MSRHVLTLLLLPTLLLTQWVNGNRCLGGCQAAGHDSRPHIHLNSVLPGTPDVKGCGCHRQREANEAVERLLAQASDTSHSITAKKLAPCPGSDDGILYLSLDSALGGRACYGYFGVDVCGDLVQPPPGLYAIHGWIDHLPNHFFSRVIATPGSDAKCPVYLRVCALLI